MYCDIYTCNTAATTEMKQATAAASVDDTARQMRVYQLPPSASESSARTPCTGCVC